MQKSFWLARVCPGKVYAILDTILPIVIIELAINGKIAHFEYALRDWISRLYICVVLIANGTMEILSM